VAAVLVAGCGAGYRPVVTPINPSGPAAQPTSLAVVISEPSPTAPGIATIVDYSGDTIMAQSPIGVGPLAFTVDEPGSTGYTVNSDGTVTNFAAAATLQQKNVTFTTLPSTAQPVGVFSPSAGLWMTDLNGNLDKPCPTNPTTVVPCATVDVFTSTGGGAQTFKLSIPVPANPVALVGPGVIGLRNYVITQGAVANGVTCNTAATTAPAGEADGIEVATNTISSRIPLGNCPVYAVQSPDSKRLFVMNRGSDTITVINSQNNTLDNQCPPPAGCVNQGGQQYFTHPRLPLSTSAGLSGAGVPTIAGPVYAEYNAATSQLVISDYDGAAISVIDVSLDLYGNDSPTFGTTYTIPVGTNPAAVTVLNDGSRAYTANQADQTVSVVDLSSHTLVKSVPVTGHPRTVVSTQNSLYGKVYVASPDSPYLTILRTDQDIIDTTVLVQGNIVDVRTTSQDANRGNANVVSRKAGFGQPCNLSAKQLATLPRTPTYLDCQSQTLQ
jgi:YVTN family beta-propeller protein